MADSHIRQLPRRRFLLAAAAVTAFSPAARIARACGSQAALRVGVIVPRSTRYPELAREFVGGFEAFAASDAVHGRMRIVPVACEGGASHAVAAATHAAECGSVDVLAGIASTELAARVMPMVESRAVPFVACDLGTDVARPRRDSALLVRHTLGYWQASCAMGSWATTHLGRRVLIAADFLESGHDLVYAFLRSFEAAGGEVVGVVRTGLPQGPSGFAEVMQAVRSTAPDFVYALYSGRRADEFLRAYEREGLARRVPLAGGAMLTERPAHAGFEGIVTAASWAPRESGPFGLLGREAAQRILAGADALGGDTGDAHELARAMATAAFESPRGRVATHAELREAATPAYVRRLVRGATGLEHAAIERIDATDAARATSHDLRSSVRTGWTRAYLTA